MEASATDPVSLQEVFALLPEVRQARRRRQSLLAILNLTAVAIDACRVRSGDAAQVLAALRNAVVHLLEEVTVVSKVAATRYFAVGPQEAFPLVTGEYQEN